MSRGYHRSPFIGRLNTDGGKHPLKNRVIDLLNVIVCCRRIVSSLGNSLADNLWCQSVIHLATNSKNIHKLTCWFEFQFNQIYRFNSSIALICCRFHWDYSTTNLLWFYWNYMFIVKASVLPLFSTKYPSDRGFFRFQLLFIAHAYAMQWKPVQLDHSVVGDEPAEAVVFITRACAQTMSALTN